MFNPLLYAIFSAFYSLFVYLPLKILSFIVLAFKNIIFLLPNVILFGTIVPTHKTLWEYTPTMFIRLLIFSVIFFLIVFTLGIVKSYFKRNNDGSLKNVFTTLKWSVFTFCLMFFIPLFLYSLNEFLSWVNDNFLWDGDKNSFSLSQKIFSMLRDTNSSISADEWNSNNCWITYSVYTKLQAGQAAEIVIMGAIMSWGTIIPLFFGGIGIVKKIFEQLFLYIISPVVLVSSSLDDGVRFKQWFRMYLSKSVIILTFFLGIQILMIFLNRIMALLNDNSTANINFFVKLLMFCVCCLGGAIGISSISDIVAQFFGERLNHRDHRGEVLGLMGTAIGITTGWGLAKKSVKGANEFLQGRSKIQQTIGTRNSKIVASQKARNYKEYKSGRIDYDEYKLNKEQLSDSVKEFKKEKWEDAKNNSSNIISAGLKFTSPTTLTKKPLNNTKQNIVKSELAFNNAKIKVLKDDFENGDLSQEDYDLKLKTILDERKNIIDKSNDFDNAQVKKDILIKLKPNKQHLSQYRANKNKVKLNIQDDKQIQEILTQQEIAKYSGNEEKVNQFKKEEQLNKYKTSLNKFTNTINYEKTNNENDKLNKNKDNLDKFLNTIHFENKE